MTKAEKERASLISLLNNPSKTTNIYSLDFVTSPEDADRFLAKIEVYLNKYTDCGVQINYDTYEVQITDNIAKISSFLLSLSAHKFERFSALLCKIFGYSISYATKTSHDQGIDFVGIREFKIYESNRKDYLIGQSKKYTNLVNITEIREFAGSILLLKNGEFSQSGDVYKNLVIRSFTSIEGIFITSYFFSNAAVTLCSNSDIIMIDFVDLVMLTEKALKEEIFDFAYNGTFIKKKAMKLINEVSIIK